jgi:hypothetical protein
LSRPFCGARSRNGTPVGLRATLPSRTTGGTLGALPGCVSQPAKQVPTGGRPKRPAPRHKQGASPAGIHRNRRRKGAALRALASPNASAQVPVRGAPAGTTSRRPPAQDWRSHGPSICRRGAADGATAPFLARSVVRRTATLTVSVATAAAGGLSPEIVSTTRLVLRRDDVAGVAVGRSMPLAPLAPADLRLSCHELGGGPRRERGCTYAA